VLKVLQKRTKGGETIAIGEINQPAFVEYANAAIIIPAMRSIAIHTFSFDKPRARVCGKKSLLPQNKRKVRLKADAKF